MDNVIEITADDWRVASNQAVTAVNPYDVNGDWWFIKVSYIDYLAEEDIIRYYKTDKLYDLNLTRFYNREYAIREITIL